MSGLTDQMKGVRESIGRIPSGAKVLLLTVLSLALVFGVYSWATQYAKQNKYEALFSRLDSRDSGEIVQKLEQKKIPYRISPDGTTILVPSTQVHTTRLSLAGEGLPRGGVVGFELMDKLSFGATDFDRRVNYLRALTGELTRTIREIDGVLDARVHIVVPENSYFVSKTKPATAAVFLKMNPSFTLSSIQLKGIMNLVSRSVEGLKPEDVAVIDLYGRLLSGDVSGSAEDRAASANLSTQQGFQRELERSLQAILERVLGPGNVVLRVSAELSFDQKTVDRVLFQPAQDGILRSMQELEETFRGEGAAPSGPSGVNSNVPQYQMGSSSGTSEYQKRDVTRNYEISEIKERTVVAPGSVKRLSVAVIVNKDLDEDAKAAIQKTVQAAIGADPERRDLVSVSAMAFDNTLLSDMKKQMEPAASPVTAGINLNSPVVLGAIAAAVVLIFISVLLAVTRRWKTSRNLALEKARVEMEAARALQAASATPEPEPSRGDVELERKKRLREDIENVARANPETVAQLIRTWIAEDRR